MRQCHYSVPARLAGWTVNVRLGATVVEVRSGGRVVARHERAVTRGTQSLVLDHYLEVLVRKPGALPERDRAGPGPWSRARSPPTHEAFWRAARRKLGDAPGTRALIEVLLAHRHLPAAAVIEGMRRALDAGTVNPEVVLVGGPPSRRRRHGAGGPDRHVLQALARYDRPTPSSAATTPCSTATSSSPTSTSPPRPAPMRRAGSLPSQEVSA